jgi:actin-related protein 5
MGNRKSLVNQIRMKNIANLASDNPNKRRRRGGDDDNFGADDNDWGIYRTIQREDVSDDEEEEDLDGALKVIETQLLKYDPDFTEEHTREAELDWTRSLIHSFTRGPYPFDPESQRDSHQLHLNVERIRVPEVLFQPAIAGVDQAGLLEIISAILTERLADNPARPNLVKDIFLTGGNTMFEGFDERLARELRAVLEVGTPLKVRKAQDPLLDAWKGAAKWASEDASKKYFVTKADFLEKGGEYIKVSLSLPRLGQVPC